MNRRNFFKVVTGFVAGIFATSVEGKKRSGTRYCGEASTAIDPNSEWAKQKYLTLDEIIKTEEQTRKVRLYCRGKNGTLCPRCRFNYPEPSTAIDPNREPLTLAKLREIKEQIDAAELKRKEQLWCHPAYIIHEDGSIEPVPYQDFYKTKFS